MKPAFPTKSLDKIVDIETLDNYCIVTCAKSILFISLNKSSDNAKEFSSTITDFKMDNFEFRACRFSSGKLFILFNSVGKSNDSVIGVYDFKDSFDQFPNLIMKKKVASRLSTAFAVRYLLITQKLEKNN